MKLLAARFSIMARELEEKKRASGDDDKDGLGGSEIVGILLLA